MRFPVRAILFLIPAVTILAGSLIRAGAAEAGFVHRVVLESPSAIEQGVRAVLNGAPRKGIGLINRGLSEMDLTARERLAGLNGLCIGYRKIRRFESAIRRCNEALAISVDWRVLNNRANALLELGRYRNAIADYERALALSPDKSRIYANLTVALARRTLAAANAPGPNGES